MAVPDELVGFAPRVDHYLDRMEEWWRHLPEEAKEWDDFDDSARVEFLIVDLSHLSAWSRGIEKLDACGELTEAQKAQFARVKALKAKYEPILDALRNGDPIPDIAA